MARALRDRLGAAAQPAIRRWDRVPIRVQGRITVALPLVAVVISAVLAISGNAERVAIESDIQRKFEMTAALGNLSSLMVNAETGMRGYLLTGQSGFLEPFDQATRDLPGSLDRLTTFAAQEPGDAPRAELLARLGNLRNLTGAQISDLTFQRDFVAAGGSAADAGLRGHLLYGKGLMDGIRAGVGDLQAEEQALLNDRIADINAIRLRDYVSVALALVAALVTRFLAWFLFRKGILHRVERLTEDLRGRRDGRPSSLAAPTKRDQMGELEREVQLLET